MKTDVSIIVNTRNAAKTLQRTMESLSFAEEIIVVDMESGDDTVKIAKKFTKNIFKHPNVGYVEPARNFAIQKAKHPWVLIIDADEVVSPGLSKKIAGLITTNSDVVCYYLPRKNIIFGKWIEKTGWWPDFQPRLLKKANVTWHDEVHSQPTIEGNIEYLPIDEDLSIIHYNYDSVSDFIQRLDKYTSFEANDTDKLSDVASSASLVESFFDEWLRRLFKDSGIEDGFHGVGLSLLQSMYQLVAKMKQWEKSEHPVPKDSPQDVLNSVKKMKSDLSYWIADYEVNHNSGFSKFYWQIRRKLRV